MLAASRVLRSLLFGISATDIPTLTVAVAMLLTIAVVAAGVPAWREPRRSCCRVQTGVDRGRSRSRSVSLCDNANNVATSTHPAGRFETVESVNTSADPMSGNCPGRRSRSTQFDGRWFTAQSQPLAADSRNHQQFFDKAW